MVELRPIQSDAITAAGYDGTRRTLAVRYESGAVYEYFDVDPELYDELLGAQPHPWSRVGERVKSHRFRQLE
ncbi:hypothetical protein GCM10022286_23780 [Gryllotalpicola daejeonensis]|uniref:KTSC domain-containing protein n=1 Tax=Gryllotalpicola daejeonensis TaxID=993087 RepID=A0ABP7ZLS9_9MICO